MQFLRDCKIQEAAHKDGDGRYAMHNVLFQPACEQIGHSPALVATNGRILALIPVTELDEGDTGGMLPVEALKAATKGKSADGMARLTANGDVRVIDSPDSWRGFNRPVEGEFPRFDMVIPKANEHDFQFSFSLDLLTKLSKALGSDSLTLKVRLTEGTRTSMNAIRVEVPDSQAIGVIMPITLDG